MTSQREQDDIAQLADGDEVWLGGRRKSRADPWQWSDARSWGFEQTWDIEFYNNPGFNCLTAGESDGMWVNDDCGERFAFVCSNPPTMMSGNHSLVFRKAALIDPKFHIWWINTLESNTIKVPGFKIDWTINNMSPYHTMDFVSKNLKGSISTPGLGSFPPPNYYKERHEYTAVIELPHNIT